MAMPDRIISAAKARALAAKWKTADGSPLDVFAKSEQVVDPVLREAMEVYASPIAAAQREEVLALGVYLAARSFEDSARKMARFRS